MCEQFGLTKAKPVHMPMDPKVVLEKAINVSELLVSLCPQRHRRPIPSIAITHE